MAQELLTEFFESATEEELRVHPKLKYDIMRMVATEAACRRVIEERDAEVRRLQDAIRVHRDQRGHDRCYLDDDALYSTLPEGKANADTTLPPRTEFLAGCAAYYDARKSGVSHEHCSLAEVMAREAKLRAALKEIEDYTCRCSGYDLCGCAMSLSWIAEVALEKIK